jgi:hypothetical protein
MTIPLLIGLVFAAAAICYVLAPLVWPGAFGVESNRATVPTAVAGDPLERLRDELFAQIVDLDFDHALGKTDEEEYQQDRAALKRQALAILHSLDERDSDVRSEQDDQIEEAVRAVRARRTAAPAGPALSDARLLELDDEVERQIAARRQRRHIPATPNE